jgi:protein-histidine pros-kinase
LGGEVKLDLGGALSDIGDPDLLVTMARMLVADWDEYLGQIEKAVAAGDPHDLRLQAHTLKSLLAMFHAEAARRVAVALEQAAQTVENVDWAACRRHFSALTTEMAGIRPLLERFVETRLIP